MPASYPISVKTYTTKNTGETIQAIFLTEMELEITAIESGLLTGTAPLNSSNSTMVNLSVTGGATFAAFTLGASTVASLVVSSNMTVTGASTFTGRIVASSGLTVTGASTFGTVQAGASTVGTLQAGASTHTSLSVSGGSTFGTVQAGASTAASLVISGGSTFGTVQAGASTAASLVVTGGSTFGTVQAGASTMSALSIGGGSTFAGRLNLNGALQLLSTSITLSSGNTNDLAIGTATTIVRLTGSSAGSTLTGFSRGQAADELLIVFNVGNDAIRFAHNTGSSAANRFALTISTGINLVSGGGAIVVYDSVIWRVGFLN